MDYLILQILLFLVLAAIIGFVAGWLLRGFGFESRLTATENQWRARCYGLQNERDKMKVNLKDNAAAAQALRDERNQIEEIKNNLARSAEQHAAAEKEVQALRGKLMVLEKLQSPQASARNTPKVEAGQPASLPAAEGEPDDLKLIRGIGPKIEQTLNRLGIYHFQQIAEFSPENVAWVNDNLRFKGRIEREDWIAQARALIENNPA